MGETYRCKEKLGEGGFGEVWRCERERDGRTFAMKRLREDAEPDDQRRFQKEVRMLDRLDHPNVVKVVGKRVHEAPFFYLMPLHATSLAVEFNRIRGEGDRIFEIFSRVFDAIEYAHEQGVIHRDLKPDNVLMNDDSEVAVSDFGLGFELDAKSTRQTRTGMRMGTFIYTAPEQLQDSKRADERSDVFSLGKMLYEAYTGPLSTAPQDGSKLPAGIRFLVERCTREDPDDRFQSVADLKQAWRGVFDGAAHRDERDELALLRARLAAPAAYESGDVERLRQLILRHVDDDEYLHDLMMELDPNVVREMHQRDPQTVRELVEKFTGFASQQRWPFGYTDEIANQCKGLYEAVDDFEVRALIIRCLAEVGVGHNRFHVLRVFGGLAESTGAEAVAVADGLDDLPEGVIASCRDYVREGKLAPEVRRALFRTRDIDIPF